MFQFRFMFQSQLFLFDQEELPCVLFFSSVLACINHRAEFLLETFTFNRHSFDLICHSNDRIAINSASQIISSGTLIIIKEI